MSRSVISTGHVAFDSQTAKGYIGTGNVCSSTQTSSFIRSQKETQCNGYTFPEGQLRSYDLAPFRSVGLPPVVERAVHAATGDSQIILYRFHHAAGGKEVVHGYVLTHDGARHHELIRSYVTGPTGKSEAIIQIMASLVSNPPELAARFDDTIVPKGVAMARDRLANMVDSTESVILHIASVIASKAEGAVTGDRWRAWEAVYLDRDPWIGMSSGCAEAVNECRAYIHGLDQKVAATATQSMMLLRDAASGACAHMVGGSYESLRVVDAMIADFGGLAHAPASPSM
jgi:hypothetical protein